ncbi:hypothetical protein [Geminocystis sp. NIES-3708]|uniref:hypothetical protein n=1 Tax=Geminocystis sp. NIES-3708 TaxID=1615909 RepID=UPI00082B6F92|nr:hypothetical protein [Geminocystis sp. NIES-3708]
MSSLQSEQNKLRFLIRQIQRMRDINFIEPAYAILQIIIIDASVFILLIKSNYFLQNLVISGLIFSVLIYLLVLISDLDNPFQYDNKSSADVDLSRDRKNFKTFRIF